MRKQVLLLTIALSVFSIQGIAATTISIEAGNVVKEVVPGPSGAVLCWLLDSDIYRPRNTSFEDAMREMKVGSLRFPYGALANNYLWHTPPYEITSRGLRPKVAAQSNAPGKWSWAVDDRGYFIDAMDFDEYMGLSERLNLKPLVCVNVHAYKFDGGPSYDFLKTSAVEWVRYAKKRAYEGIYWQLGNEEDHHGDLITRPEYVALYADFAAAMKVVDPNIKIGPGILSQSLYYSDILAESPDLVDFVTVHQYNWGVPLTSYDEWKNDTQDYTKNLRRAQLGIASKPDLEILVTETNAKSGTKLPGEGHTTRALWWFEVLMNEISFKNVTHTYFWGTHSPWSGQNQKENGGTLLLDNNNNRTQMGDVNMMVNKHLEGQELVEVDRVNSFIRAYASRSPQVEQVTVFLLNKNDQWKDGVEVVINNFPEIKSFRRWEFKGRRWNDYNPVYSENGSIQISGNSFATSLAPLSVTIVKVSDVDMSGGELKGGRYHFNSPK